MWTNYEKDRDKQGEGPDGTNDTAEKMSAVSAFMRVWAGRH